MKSSNRPDWKARFFLFVCLSLALTARAAEPAPNWVSMFDGKSMKGWAVTEFGGHGEVAVKDGNIEIGMGAALGGTHWTNEFPKSNYEISLEAQKFDGSDFFCGLTFPVGESHCSFIVGGWGGSVVGLSSVDGLDASENETTKYTQFPKGKWFKIKVRVTDQKIETWIDDEKSVDQILKGHRISLRPGDIDMSKPLGVATYQTTSLLRDIKYRKLAPAAVKKVAFIAGKKSHGPGEHEYEKSLNVLKKCLETSPNVTGVKCDVYTNGWPADPKALDDAATIVVFSDGSDHVETANPLLVGDRLQTLDRLMKKGVGLVALHYTVFVPEQRGGEEFLRWIGGHFHYQGPSGSAKWVSKIETKDYSVRVASKHPVTRGVAPFNIREEYYFNLRFPQDRKGWSPIATFGPDGDATAVVGWAIERADGGRGFGYTGGHFHKNLEIENARRLLLNAILYTAGLDVPLDGVQSTVEAADFKP